MKQSYPSEKSALPAINELLPPEDLAGLTRRERKKQETRWRIYDAALSLMLTHGYDEVKIEDICEKADVARATYFKHFSTKAALMSAYHERQVEKIRLSVAESDAPARGKLELVAKLVAEYGDHNSALSSRLFQAFIEDHGDEFRVDDTQSGIVGIVTDIIKQGQEDGSFNDKWRSDLVAITLVSSWLTLFKARTQGRKTIGSNASLDILSLLMTAIER